MRNFLFRLPLLLAVVLSWSYPTYIGFQRCGIFFHRRPVAERPDTMKPGDAVGMFASTVRITCGYGDGSGCLGSGVIVLWDGEIRILTARHVIEKAKSIQIRDTTGRKYAATVIASSDWDCAVLAPSEEIVGICPSELASNEEIAALHGDVLQACGYGSKGNFAVDTGHFNDFQTKGEEKGASQASDGVADWFTIDGSCRSGDSGGPIFDANGRVVGILWGTNGEIVIGVQAGRLGILLNEAEEKTSK